MKNKLIRVVRTAVQAAIGSAISAIIAGIGTSTTLGSVDWKIVASTTALTTIVAFLMNIQANLPENDTQISEREEL